jgi:hypothetical protein
MPSEATERPSASPRDRRLVVFPTIGILAALAPGPPSVASDASHTIRYSTGADFRVLTISLSLPVPPDYSLPAVRIYGDGRVWRHRPSYMKRGGDYEAWLAPEDLDRLLRFVADQRLMAFDPEKVEAKQHEAERRRLAETGGVPGVADAPTTTVHIDLEAYASPGVDKSAKGFAKTISWYALDSVVSWYPEITELRRLQEVAEVLWELGNRAEEAAARGETVISLPDLPGADS